MCTRDCNQTTERNILYTVAQGGEKPTDGCRVPLLATANDANYQTTRALEVSNKNDGLQEGAIYVMKNKYEKRKRSATEQSSFRQQPDDVPANSSDTTQQQTILHKNSRRYSARKSRRSTRQYTERALVLPLCAADDNEVTRKEDTRSNETGIRHQVKRAVVSDRVRRLQQAHES